MTSYTATRAAAAEIATSLVTLGSGALAMKQLTPGVATLATTLAGVLARAMLFQIGRQRACAWVVAARPLVGWRFACQFPLRDHCALRRASAGWSARKTAAEAGRIGMQSLSPPMTSGRPHRHNLAVGVHQPHQVIRPALERLGFLLPVAVPIIDAFQLGHCVVKDPLRNLIGHR